MKDPNACRPPELRRKIAASGGTARGRKLSAARRKQIAQMGYKAMQEVLRARGKPPQAQEVAEGEGDAA